VTVPDIGEPVIAAFDFDGTITRRDTLLPFLARLRGRRRLAVALAVHGWSLARMSAGLESRDTVKDRFLLGLLGGLPAELVARAGDAYGELLATGIGLRPTVVARIDHHRSLGHRLVVISASPEIYVRPFAERFGFETALATRLELDDDGRLTGRVLGQNCRAAEKVRRLEEWMGDGPARVVAYGDSSGDTELLARADVGIRVRGRRELAPAVLT
jgi:phosphatidylglycerophosphatase C